MSTMKLACRISVAIAVLEPMLVFSTAASTKEGASVPAIGRRQLVRKKATISDLNEDFEASDVLAGDDIFVDIPKGSILNQKGEFKLLEYEKVNQNLKGQTTDSEAEPMPFSFQVEKFKTTSPFQDYDHYSGSTNTKEDTNDREEHGYCPSDASIKWNIEGISTYESNQVNTFVVDTPDPGMCAGNGYVLQTVNSAVRIYDAKNGKPLSSVVSLYDLYGLQQPQQPEENGGVVFDANYCHFDPVSECWFIVAREVELDEEFNFKNGTGYVILAASTTEDPTGSWEIYRIPASNNGMEGTPDHQCLTGSCLPQDPRIGVDSNGVFITTDEFVLALTDPLLSFRAAQVYAVSKNSLGASGDGAAQFIDVFLFDTLNPAWQPIPGIPGLSLVPSLSAGDQFSQYEGGTNYFVSNIAIFELALSNKTSSETLILWSLTNTESLNTDGAELQLNGIPIGTQEFSVPSGTVQKSVRPLRVTEFGLNPGMIFDRVGVFVDARYGNGKIWAVLATGVAFGQFKTEVAWFLIDPEKGTVQNQGYIPYDDETGESRTFPSLALNTCGSGVIGLTCVGDDLFLSQGYAPFNEIDGVGEVQMIKEGNGPKDGFTGYTGDGRHSWGNFGAAAVDGDKIYVAGGYIESSCSVAEYRKDLTCGGTMTRSPNWSTRMARIDLH